MAAQQCIHVATASGNQQDNICPMLTHLNILDLRERERHKSTVAASCPARKTSVRTREREVGIRRRERGRSLKFDSLLSTIRSVGPRFGSLQLHRGVAKSPEGLPLFTPAGSARRSQRLWEMQAGRRPSAETHPLFVIGTAGPAATWNDDNNKNTMRRPPGDFLSRWLPLLFG